MPSGFEPYEANSLLSWTGLDSDDKFFSDEISDASLVKPGMSVRNIFFCHKGNNRDTNPLVSLETTLEDWSGQETLELT